MQVQVGEKAEAREYGPLTTRMFVRYAGASGYPSVFSQGMHSAALLGSFAVDWLGAENVRRFAVRFREQVWPDDVLSCSGEITAISQNESGRLVTAELTATRQTGGIAVSASADFLLPILPLI
jgi:acyl dehydratase